MDSKLLKKLGNIDQIAGIRNAKIIGGRGEDIRIAEFYNAAGLRFTVVPDLGMDLFELSYKGINFSFQSKNGMTSPQAFNAMNGEFAEQWPGGMMVTCGLDNVGGHTSEGGIFPTHGRIGYVPAKHFGTVTYWEGDQYFLKAVGEIHQTKMYSRHLEIQRTITTELNSKKIRIHDTVTNYEAEDEPYMLLYHINFGYPLLDEEAVVHVSEGAETQPMNDLSTDPVHMMEPVDGRTEELYFHTNFGKTGEGRIWNEKLGLGAYVKFSTENLPNMLEWKNMKSHDYVLALEPCNTFGIDRAEALKQGKIAVIPSYSSIENEIEIGILEA
ncbi:MAG: DUF4432 family protein [Lachnospiraceae bacterium]|nr:DUF4432 family protein [Lachnospiraceae bacterium]